MLISDCKALIEIWAVRKDPFINQDISHSLRKLITSFILSRRALSHAAGSFFSMLSMLRKIYLRLNVHQLGVNKIIHNYCLPLLTAAPRNLADEFRYSRLLL